MTTTADSAAPPSRHLTNHLARLVLLTFIVTFVTSRVLVILIMSRTMPDIFLHVKGTHVHHLNDVTAIIYGIGLALTFDEFGMWVHLGGSYWQRASYDAVVTVASVLALIAYAPTWEKANWKHKLVGVLLLGALIGFGVLLFRSARVYGQRHGWPSVTELETEGPE